MRSYEIRLHRADGEYSASCFSAFVSDRDALASALVLLSERAFPARRFGRMPGGWAKFFALPGNRRLQRNVLPYLETCPAIA